MSQRVGPANPNRPASAAPPRNVPRPGLGRAAALFLLASLAAGCATRPGTGEPTASSFSLDEDSLRLSRALALYAQALLIEPSRPEAAAEHLAWAAESDPGRLRIHTRMADEAVRRRRLDDAIEALRTAAAANPRSLEARIRLAGVYQLAGRADDAASAFEDAIRIAPTNANLYAAVAALRFATARDALALRTLERGLRRAEPPPQPILVLAHNQGREFLSTGQNRRALPCFDLLARHATENRHVYLHVLGEIHHELGHPRDAVRALEAALREPQILPESIVRLALLLAPDDPDRAIRVLRDGAARLPNEPRLSLVLAQIYSSRERHAEAADTYAAIESAHTGTNASALQAGFYLQYGAACDRAGFHDRAERVFEAGIARFPDSASMLNYLAYMWAERGESLDRALEYSKRSLTLEPESGAFLDTLGWIYFKQGKLDDALREILRALHFMPDDPTVAEHAGDILEALDRPREAADWWQRAFLRESDSAALAEKLRRAGIDVRRLRREARRAGPQTGGAAP